jgi:hypothetical protein
MKLVSIPYELMKKINHTTIIKIEAHEVCDA